MTRPRIYALYSNRAALTPFGGDMISELETLRWMSQVADVYYNNVLFDPAGSVAGDETLEIEGPVGTYDLVYIRHNLDVLADCRSRKLRTLYFGEMRSEAFALADYIAVHTQGEARHFTSLAARADLPIRTLLMEQPGRADFSPRHGAVETEHFRRRWGEFTLGFFGRIDEAAMPKTLMATRDLIRHYIRDVSIVFAGKLRWKFSLPSDVVHEPAYLSGDQMPYALSACAAAIGIEQPEAEWAGSNRTLDSIRCGVPIITRPYDARVEQLGSDYPLYFEDGQELLRKLVWLRYDTIFQDEVSAYMAELPPRFTHAAIQSRNAERLEQLLREKPRRRRSSSGGARRKRGSGDT